MRELDYVGKGVTRVDARDKVVGKTKYAGDIRLSNMCFGSILFSRYPRARVVKIDSSEAEMIKGVRAVITHKDIKGNNLYGYNIHHHPVLVPEGGEARFLGDSIAFVVAETSQIADEAIKTIRVIYEPLKPICSPQEAMADGAPLIHQDFEGNICAKREFIYGDVEKGFQACDVIVEQTYRTQLQEHAFLETEAGVAFLDDKGTVHIYSALQSPYIVVEDISYALGIPKNKIHIRGTPVGGAFGGKSDTTMQVHLATMAYVSQCPVSLVFSREESFLFHPKRHPYEIKMKVGARRTGKILAMEGEAIADAGPYSGRTPEVLRLTVMSLPGPYRIPNAKISGTAYYTNNMESGAMRGFGAPQAAIARECVFDKLAGEINMDPLELRRRNFLKERDPMMNPYLQKGPISLQALSSKISAMMRKPTIPSHRNRRIGRGFCFDMPVFDVSAFPELGKAGVGIAVEMFSDGSVCVFAGGVELGQGVTTVLAQMAAEELGVPIALVAVELSDTRTCPRAGRTSASRLTYVLGNALLLATDKIRSTILKRAEGQLGISHKDLFLRGGKISQKGNPQKWIEIAEVATMCSDEGLNLREEAWYKHPEDRAVYGHTFIGTAAEVEVDVTNGHVRILKLVNVHDTGKVINPKMAKGQLFGGAVQALGYALIEDMVVEDGYLKTPSFAEYPIPTSMDLPKEMVAESIETSHETGPYGAKGIGEHACNTTTPAILNAIFDATGVEPTNLPVLPEHIMAAYEK